MGSLSDKRRLCGSGRLLGLLRYLINQSCLVKMAGYKSRSFFASCPQQYNYAFEMVYFPRGFAQLTITYNESVGPFVA